MQDRRREKMGLPGAAAPPPCPGFGNIHKINGNVLAALHTFLINTLLIFNFFSVIMYI
jgi:hypothetical protein